VTQGESVSVWLRFAGAADGRAYFGFGASPLGTLSLVAAPNTGQLLLQDNTGYGNVTLAAVSQRFLANHWYRLEVDWGAGGSITGRLFDSNGTTLLKSVSAADNAFTAGGIAFRATGHDKQWDAVTAAALTGTSTAKMAAVLPAALPAVVVGGPATQPASAPAGTVTAAGHGIPAAAGQALPANAIDRLFTGGRDEGLFLFSPTARASRRTAGDAAEALFGQP
jgi:hypothetical protein